MTELEKIVIEVAVSLLNKCGLQIDYNPEYKDLMIFLQSGSRDYHVDYRRVQYVELFPDAYLIYHMTEPPTPYALNIRFSGNKSNESQRSD